VCGCVRGRMKGSGSEKDASYHDDTTDEDQGDKQIAWLREAA
jgi:hypothetical protein